MGLFEKSIVCPVCGYDDCSCDGVWCECDDCGFTWQLETTEQG